MKGKDQDTKSNGHLHKLVDGSAKIIAAGAIVAAAIIANNFQSKMSTISLLSNRELAESQLRGEMFANLISPIIGSRDENNKYDPRREQLLVELLALNFHEHFESKPLMLYTCANIGKDKEIDEDEQRKLKNSLESIARRISARQIAALRMEGGAKNALSVEKMVFSKIAKKGSEWDQAIEKEIREKLDESFRKELGKPIKEVVETYSPDKKWAMQITIKDIHSEAEKHSIDVFIDIWRKNKIKEILYKIKNFFSKIKGYKGHEEPITFDFQLTYYDFPLTDNTILGDGNRFAFIINDIQKQDIGPDSAQDLSSDAEVSSADISLIWFPKDYFTPRERPINYSKFREEIGADLN